MSQKWTGQESSQQLKKHITFQTLDLNHSITVGFQLLYVTRTRTWIWWVKQISKVKNELNLKLVLYSLFGHIFLSETAGPVFLCRWVESLHFPILIANSYWPWDSQCQNSAAKKCKVQVRLVDSSVRKQIIKPRLWLMARDTDRARLTRESRVY